MKKMWAWLTLVAAVAPLAAASQQITGLSIQVCLLSEKPAVYVFWQASQSVTKLLNVEGAAVTVSGPTTTVVVGDTVFQFSDNSVQVLQQGNLGKWPCLDVTREVVGVLAQVAKTESVEKDQLLAKAEKARLAEAVAADVLRQKLRASYAELTAMTLALEEQRKRAEKTQSLLAAAQASGEQAKAGADKVALLAEAQHVLTEKDKDLLKAARDMALLNEQMVPLRVQLATLQALLDASAAKDSADEVQIDALGSQLNSAVAQVAAEQKKRADLEETERKRLAAENQDLSKYRSEFFGQIGRLLSGRPGVRVVGDRFVFDSEVLFNPGSADLAPEGQAQIASVVATLKKVVDQIPPQTNWIIRVDGHTDNIPLSGAGQFADNWTLSQARALSVVKYMQYSLGFPPERLAATGFGEYQPVASGDTPAARALNRRIEFGLVDR